MDEELKIKQRRYKSDLTISGGTYIVFGIWNIVKTLIQLTGGYQSLVEEMAEQNISAFVTKTILAILFILVAVIIIPFHLFIGRSAIAYANDRKAKRIFFILTPLLLIEAVAEVPMYVMMFTDENQVYESLIAAIVMQITTIIVLFDMLRSMYFLKNIRKETAEVT